MISYVVGPTLTGNRLFFGVWASNRRRKMVSPAATWESQDHYAALGLSSRASSADIKRAYRLLALKYHPDVSKDLKAAEVFKSIHLAYEVLSDEAARSKYDNALKFQEGSSKSWQSSGFEDYKYNEGVRIYRWDELRQRMREERHKQYYDYDSTDENSSDNMTDMFEEDFIHERGPFSEVLRFSFFVLFFMQTLGTQMSLTLCGLAALVDKQLDAGYKLGYVLAWAMGGRGGILLSMCLSFASWLCGKSSSSLVVLVVTAMWVGANVARFAPIPQGALLTLVYMSMKLQVDLS